MSDEVLVKCENISKKFCLSLKRSLWYGVQDICSEFNPWKGKGDIVGPVHNIKLRKDEFWAVKDVSFELKRGECLGLIGHNGAGKSTLLKMLNGLNKPDHGRITMRGRIGALIELNAGFNPILTGRENVYIYGSIIGFSKKEIDQKYKEIVAFAELTDFMEMPIRSYSSGMKVRLGFAIAAQMEPDILLLDEVLAVGDAAFRNKCYNKIGELKKTAVTIFVSHSMELISQFCDKVVVLSKGYAEFNGDVAEGIGRYESLIEDNSSNADKNFETVVPPVTSFRMIIDPIKVSHGENIRLRIEVNSDQLVSNITLRIVFYDQQNRLLAEWNNRRIGSLISLTKGVNTFQVNLGPILLKMGKYSVGLVLNDDSSIAMLVWSFKKHEFIVDGFTTLGPPIAFKSDLLRL